MVDLHSTLSMVLIPFHLKTMSGIQTSGYTALSLTLYFRTTCLHTKSLSLSQTRHNLPDVREPHESGEVDEGEDDDGDDGEGGGDVEAGEEEDGHEDGGQRDGQRGEREGHHVQVLKAETQSMEKC